MQFSQIPGLTAAKSVLTHSVAKNHVAHAQLFHGLEGSAALSMAIAFATYLNCSNKTESDSCGECASCSKMAKLAHPDVTYLYPTAGGKKVLSENFMAEWREFVAESPFGNISDWLYKINIKQGNFPVEEARKLITDLSLKSYEGGYKIVIIWRVEFFNNAMANALLKLLEEPPKDTILLLTCESTDRLLTTILSRTQRFAIPQFTQNEIAEYLVAKLQMNSERANELAFLAQGNMNKAVSLATTGSGNEHEWFAKWIRYTFAFDVINLVSFADEFDSFGKEKQKSIIEYALTIFREIFLYVSGNENLVKLEAEPLAFVQKFSKVFKFQNLPLIQGLLDESISHIDRNVRAKIIFLDTSLQMARLIK
ncbi:DNA polymerase-3 subunit delta' [Spirosomataceae bacterium TFI 002]|nr:DNA polymerase-3 subunit delta' [Spirosomataceae bacterium TFI 002]